MVPREPPELGLPGVALAIAGPRRAAAVVAIARPPHETPVATHAGPVGIPVRLPHPRPVPRAPRASLRVSPGRQRFHRPLHLGGVRFAPVRRQFQLARSDLVSLELSHHRILAEVPSLLWR